jgi:acetate kinase
LQAPGEVHAVGHRVVHGGERYTSAVRITPEVKQAIDALAELAPLHNPGESGRHPGRGAGPAAGAAGGRL